MSASPSKTPRKPVTLLDVARTVGLSICVVSKVLAGKRGVAAATRERVLAAAARLGYKRNAAASLLAAQRCAAPGQTLRPVIAYLRCSGEAPRDQVFMSACEAMGFDGRCHLADKTTTRMLWAQGVNGILVNAQHKGWPPGYFEKSDWSNFSLASVGQTPLLPCHAVRHSPFRYLWRTMEQVFSRGYRKPAVLLHHSSSPTDDHARLGALMAFNSIHQPDGVECVWLQETLHASEARRAQAISRWLANLDADALIFTFPRQWLRLAEMGVDLPTGMPCASVFVEDAIDSVGSLLGTEIIAGCPVQVVETYTRAVSILGDLIGRNVRGPVVYPMVSVVEPTWREGTTLPRRNGRKRPGKR